MNRAPSWVNCQGGNTAVIWHLGPVNIKLPFTENEVKELGAQFEKAYVILQCLGAIDGLTLRSNNPQ